VKGVKSSRTQTRRSFVSAGPTHTLVLLDVVHVYAYKSEWVWYNRESIESMNG
jgi:hypothetical protein